MIGSNRRRRSVAAFAALASAAALGLAACGSGDSGGPPKLTWYINPDGGGSDPTKPGQAQLAAQCTEEAGGKYTIEIQLLPNSASDQRQQLLRICTAMQ